MSLVAVLVAASVPAIAGQRSTPFSPPPEQCAKSASVQAADPGKKAKPRRLAELPPANAYSAVYRKLGRCEVPVVVKYGIGGK